MNATEVKKKSLIQIRIYFNSLNDKGNISNQWRKKKITQ